jgi:hypothetical protein
MALEMLYDLSMNARMAVSVKIPDRCYGESRALKKYVADTAHKVLNSSVLTIDFGA